MNCKSIERLIYLYKDGELNAREMHLVKDHLAGCADCRKLREELLSESRRLIHTAKELDHGDSSTYYKNRIIANAEISKSERSNLESGKRSERFISYFCHPIYRYASAAIIAGLVITFLIQNYSTYLRLTELESRFGNPSLNEARAENKAIVFAREDINLIKETSLKGIRRTRYHTELKWFKNNQFLLMSFRRHRYIQELANHNRGFDTSDILRMYNKSTYIRESKRIQN